MKHIALFILSLFSYTAAAEEKPNFIIIFTDDQGYQDLGCFGSPDIKTPHIDKMAEEGMKLTSFYAQTVCGPSRLALMTGSYPMRTERAAHDDGLFAHPAVSLNEIMIPEILKPLGYKTGMIGKWDLAGRRNKNTFSMDLGPYNQGFDYTFWAATSNDHPVDLFLEKEVVVKKAKDSTLTERYTDKAIEFIDKNKEEPFFLYLAHSMPHTKLGVSEKFKGKSEEGIYGDVIEELDHNVGRILTHIKEQKLDKNTYIIFTSDNGPWWIKKDHGGHAKPLRAGKTSTYDGGVRVPFVIWAPGKVPAGTSSDLVTATLDILPTIAELAGAEVPSDRVIDGHDISGIFHGEQKELDRTFFYYQHQALRAVRDGDWKLHLAHTPLDKSKDGRVWARHVAPEDRAFLSEIALYNLKEDIGETKNVAAEHPEIVEKLMKHLDFAKKDIGYHGVFGENSRRLKTEATEPKSGKKGKK